MSRSVNGLKFCVDEGERHTYIVLIIANLCPDAEVIYHQGHIYEVSQSRLLIVIVGLLNSICKPNNVRIEHSNLLLLLLLL